MLGLHSCRRRLGVRRIVKTKLPPARGGRAARPVARFPANSAVTVRAPPSDSARSTCLRELLSPVRASGEARGCAGGAASLLDRRQPRDQLPTACRASSRALGIAASGTRAGRARSVAWRVRRDAALRFYRSAGAGGRHAGECRRAGSGAFHFRLELALGCWMRPPTVRISRNTCLSVRRPCTTSRFSSRHHAVLAQLNARGVG